MLYDHSLSLAGNRAVSETMLASNSFAGVIRSGPARYDCRFYVRHV